MSELTREELDTRLDTIESRIDRHFSENDAKMEARFAQAEARNEARFREAETRAQKQTVELIKWMITTALAATAVGGGFLGILITNTSPRQPPAPIVITIPPPVQPAPAR